MAKRKEKKVEELGAFQLTSLLIRRARELMSGSPALIETELSEPVGTAFEEYASGKLSVPDEAAKKGKE